MSYNPCEGARNLILEAIAARQGETLVMVVEDLTVANYDALVIRCITETAVKLGLHLRTIVVSSSSCTKEILTQVSKALNECDHVLFLSSLGDSLRFNEFSSHGDTTMCYAMDIGTLGSTGCTTSFNLMRKIQLAYEEETNLQRDWHITCPYGTDLYGSQDVTNVMTGNAPDFTIKRFPVCTPRPILCDNAEGVVALTHWLSATNNRRYDNEVLLIEEPVFAFIDAGRMVDLQGPKSQVEAVRVHHQRVGKLFDLDPWCVHSWHAGMNPGISYPVLARPDIPRWSKAVFPNPRYLHFHTCGNFAPGEITWSIFDPNVTFGVRSYWSEGHFCFLDRPEMKQMLKEHGYKDGLEISREIGVSIKP